MKTKVGYSNNINAFEAGRETALKALLNEQEVGLVFTSCVYNQKDVISGIESVCPNAKYIGCTSSAAICTQDGYLNNETGYAGMMTFGRNVEVGVSGSKKTKETPREIGRRIAQEAISQIKGDDIEPDYFFMTADPGSEEEYMKGIQDVIGKVPVFGGSAADNTVEGNWSIICNGKTYNQGCAVAVFYTDSIMKNIYTGAYNETSKVGVITKVRNERTLVEIDNKPATEVYSKWTDKSLEELKEGNILVESICSPLGVKDPIGNITAVRHPMFANDDLSINVGANLVENTAVILLSNTPKGILKANAKTVNKLNEQLIPTSYFLVHCGGRRLGLSLNKLEEKIYPEIKKATGDKEFLMVFTFGEYGHNEHSANTVGGLSLSYTGFGE